MFKALVLAFLVLCGPALADDPERREPSLSAPPATAFAWTSKGNLRYTWVLPDGVAPTDHRNLIILCHGTGLDYRWGSANYKPGKFRPADIVVSVDGPSPGQSGTRLFLGQEADADAFAAFITEMRETFHPGLVLIYGHSQGSFFVCYFAGLHPELIDGVVAHASGVWIGTQYNGDVAGVPIAFMHGTADPVVPYGQSVGGRDWYLDQGHQIVQLRRMPGYNHWPNGDRASECLDWCIGMRTKDPKVAFEAAMRMLAPKGVDEYGYEMAPWYSGTRDVARRFEDAGPRPFSKEPLERLSDHTRNAYRMLGETIEAAGSKHVAKLRDQIKSREDLKLDGRPWLGHLACLREDFRGVNSVEAWLKELGYEELVAEQKKAWEPLAQVYWGRRTPAEKFDAGTSALTKCFLLDTLPADMPAQLETWYKAAAESKLGPDSGRAFGAVAQWRSSRAEGLKQYQEIWKARTAP